MMVFSSDVAQHVCDSMIEATGAPMIVAADDGRIMAASDKSRIGQRHAGAARILSGAANEVAITDEEADASDGAMRPGYSVAVDNDGARIASIGLTGAPDTMRPLARLATNWLLSELRAIDRDGEFRTAMAQTANEIADMLDSIRDIAKKTNLLALNATIEAARAGEAGRGFSVVAGEVKALSLQTNDTAARISSKVDSVRSAAEQGRIA